MGNTFLGVGLTFVGLTFRRNFALVSRDLYLGAYKRDLKVLKYANDRSTLKQRLICYHKRYLIIENPCFKIRTVLP